MTAAERIDDDGRGEPRRTDRPRGRALYERGRAALERARTRPRTHRLALLVAIAVGLVLTWFHWLGLVLGGALVGVVSQSGRRALLAGLGLGIFVLVAFVATLGGDAGAAFAMTPASYVTVGSALALPVFGSLVRYLG